MCKLGWHLDDAITVINKDSLPLWLNLFDMVVSSSSIGVTQSCASRLTCTEMCLCKADASYNNAEYTDNNCYYNYW